MTAQGRRAAASSYPNSTGSVGPRRKHPQEEKPRRKKSQHFKFWKRPDRYWRRSRTVVKYRVQRPHASFARSYLLISNHCFDISRAFHPLLFRRGMRLGSAHPPRMKPCPAPVVTGSITIQLVQLPRCAGGVALIRASFSA